MATDFSWTSHQYQGLGIKGDTCICKPIRPVPVRSLKASTSFHTQSRTTHIGAMKRGKKCFVEHCFAAAPFASTTNPEIHACEKHKKRDFVNMRNKRCLAEGCYRNPHYGVSRLIDPNSKAQFCTKHKAPGMQNVNGGRCAGPNCSKQPRFSFPGEKGKYCSKHREEGMVDVLYTPCAAPGCKKHPHFGFIEGGPRFCAQHRADGMVDVKHRRCAVKGCRRDRIQIIAGCRKRGKFCELHTAEQDALDASSEGNAITDREVSSSDGDRKREGDLKAEIEDDSAYMSSEGSQRGVYTEEGGYGVYDSPSGRPMKTFEYAPPPLAKQMSIYSERGQRPSPSNIEAATMSSDSRAPYKRTRLSEVYDSSQKADEGGGQRRGVPYHRFHEDTPYPLFQRKTTSKINLKVVNATADPVLTKGCVKPFRLRCDKPTFNWSDFPSYPNPWDFTREGHRLAMMETRPRRWSTNDGSMEQST